jgi:hypothetical protein
MDRFVQVEKVSLDALIKQISNLYEGLCRNKLAELKS